MSLTTDHSNKSDSDLEEQEDGEDQLLNDLIKAEKNGDVVTDSENEDNESMESRSSIEGSDEDGYQQQDDGEEQDDDDDDDEKPQKPKKIKLNNDDDEYDTKKRIQSEIEEQLVYNIFGNKEKFLTNLANTANGIKQNDSPVVSDDDDDDSDDDGNNDGNDDKESKKKSLKRRKPVWHDSDDENLAADDVIDYEQKGAPRVHKPGKYKEFLVKKFQTIHPQPEWANINRRRTSTDSENDENDKLLKTVGLLNVPKKSLSSNLLPNILEFKRMKDLNRATYSEGPGITSVEFHPTSSVAIVTGGNRSTGIATIYSIDGRKNDKLHNIEFKDFPIKQCRINRSGGEAIIGGTKKWFYSYDLMTGETARIFLPKIITKLTQFEMSPCGDYIVVIGRFGEVHLLAASTKELICSFKQEHPSTSVTFDQQSRRIFSHSVDAEVSIFDLRQQRLVHRFNDEGCINGTVVRLSKNDKLLATGSEQGVVNVYEFDQVLREKNPKPIKSIFNLTTGITSCEFNHSSEILAIGSKHISDAVKLVHFPTGTIFSNFPGMNSKIGKPNVISFSPLSGYLAIGNLAKEVPLYRLKHFSNY